MTMKFFLKSIMMFVKLFLILAICFLFASASEYKRVCYYPNWGQYRGGDGRFSPEKIDTTLCSHIIYAFAKLLDNHLVTIEENDEAMYRKITDLKLVKPSLKTLLAVGGGSAGTYEMTKMISTRDSRKQFIDQAVKFLRQKNFDGLDLDFEFPGSNDKLQFTQFIQETKAAFDSESISSRRPALLLTIAIPGDKERLENGYQLNIIHRYLDFINIMSYDYHGAWESTTGHLAPLFSTDDLNTDWIANYVASKGVDYQKIIIGIPLYGRCYTLANANQNDIGARTIGPCPAGEYSQTAGILFYYEICSKYLKKSQTVVKWSDSQQVSYLVSGNIWIGFDNQKSLTRKVDYIKSKGFGGWMVWEISQDDFNGKFCGSKDIFPLLKTLNSQSIGFLTNEKVKATNASSHTSILSTNTLKPDNSIAKNFVNAAKPTDSSISVISQNPKNKLCNSDIRPSD